MNQGQIFEYTKMFKMKALVFVFVSVVESDRCYPLGKELCSVEELDQRCVGSRIELDRGVVVVFRANGEGWKWQ